MAYTFRASRWLVYSATLVVTVLNFSIMFSLGSMFVPMLDKYRASRPSTALVQSLMIGMSGFAVVAGLLISSFGLAKVALAGTFVSSFGFCITLFATSVYHLYICISVIGGIGVTTLYMCSTVAIRQLFRGRAALTALAVQFSCIGIGAIGYPYLLQFLASVYGVNGTFFIIGGLLLNNLCAVLLFIEDKASSEEIGREKLLNVSPDSAGSDNKKNENLSLYKSSIAKLKHTVHKILTKPYVATLIATAVATSFIDGYTTVYVDLYMWKTFTERQGIGSIIVYQICNILTRLISGMLKQFRWINSFGILIIGSLLGGIGVLIINVSSKYAVAYVGSGLLGVSAGTIIAGSGFVVADIVPIEEFGTAYGMVLSSIAVLSVGTGPLFGAIRDGTGSYATMLLIFGINFVTVAILYVMALLTNISAKRSERTSMNATRENDPDICHVEVT